MTRARIIKYKTCLDVIYHHTLKDGAKLSKDEVDDVLKTGAEVSGSASEMSTDELDNLIEYTYFFAEQIGCQLKETGTEKIKLNFNRE